MTKLSLEQIHVPVPCPVAWDAMRGDNAARFCEHCQEHVHDLSAMSAMDAQRLVCQSGGQLCVRFAKADDGHVLTLGYRSKPLKTGWTWRAWTAISLSAALVTGVVNAAFFGKRVVPVIPLTPTPPMVMGKISPMSVPNRAAGTSDLETGTTDDGLICPKPK